MNIILVRLLHLILAWVMYVFPLWNLYTKINPNLELHNLIALLMTFFIVSGALAMLFYRYSARLKGAFRSRQYDLFLSAYENEQLKEKLMIALFFYVVSIVSLLLYMVLGGDITLLASIFIYVYLAAYVFGLIYAKYGLYIKKIKTPLVYSLTLMLTLLLVYSGIYVDRHIQDTVHLPAEFFPTSQTALLFVAVPLVIFAAFYIIAHVFYFLSTYLILNHLFLDGEKRKNLFDLALKYVLFTSLLLLIWGAGAISKKIIEEDYKEYYNQVLVEYSYRRNEGVCTNIDDTSYVSHLRTSGVSVAVQQPDGNYLFSVENKCVRVEKKAE